MRRRRRFHPAARPCTCATGGNSMGRWLAVLVLGLVAGAGVILLAEPGATESGGIASPSVLPKASSASSSNGVTDLNGQHIHGVKALDVAAETQPHKPLDPATRVLLP